MNRWKKVSWENERERERAIVHLHVVYYIFFSRIVNIWTEMSIDFFQCKRSPVVTISNYCWKNVKKCTLNVVSICVEHQIAIGTTSIPSIRTVDILHEYMIFHSSHKFHTKMAMILDVEQGTSIVIFIYVYMLMSHM